MDRVLGLIPARGGSKSIPHKNIAPLAGRPLLAYTCEAALGSRRLTRVILSTDDEEIARIGRDCGVEVPFMRPPELAADDTPSLPVARHAVRWLIEHEGWEPEVLVLLQPTSPLRRAHHLDEALERLEQTAAETVVSVVEVPHQFSPYALMRLQDNYLSDFWPEPLPFDRFHRQNLPALYARNGPAILACRIAVMEECQSFYGPHVIPYVMGREESVDIDTPYDLRLAEWLISRLTSINRNVTNSTEDTVTT
jgi:CMP-N-acetylneuraminic acid synthetase